MRPMNIALSAVMGIALLTGSIATAANGISDEDMACCKKAVSMQTEADRLGFDGFALADYPVVFNDGRHDYAVHTDGSAEKREPVLSTFAATVFENNGSFEVIVPTKASMGTLAVMMARVKAQLRRNYDYHEEKTAEKLTCGDVSLDPAEGTVTKSGSPVELTKTEYLILEYLLKNKGRILTKQQIFAYAWGNEFIADDSTVMVHISNDRTNKWI